MIRPHRWLLLLACGLLPSVAHASDFSGVVTIVFGIPGLLIADLVAAGFFAAPSSRRQKVAAALLLGPVLIVAVWVLWGDTAQMVQRGLPDDLLFSAVYALLLLVLIGLGARILLRPLAPEASAERATP